MSFLLNVWISESDPFGNVDDFATEFFFLYFSEKFFEMVGILSVEEFKVCFNNILDLEGILISLFFSVIIFVLVEL